MISKNVISSQQRRKKLHLHLDVRNKFDTVLSILFIIFKVLATRFKHCTAKTEEPSRQFQANGKYKKKLNRVHMK